MSPLRDISDGLTEGEIRALVHTEMRDALQEQNKLLEKIADGAQASINTALLLHGDASLGIKGALPDLQEKVAAQDIKFTERSAVDDIWRANVGGRLEKLEAGQEKLEAGQHKIRRCVLWTLNKSAALTDDWKKLASAAGLIFALFSGVPGLYAPVKHFVMSVVHAIERK